MGEIKSTLDLVLERTRNLNLSDAEREQQKRDEFGKRLRGLILRFRKGEESVDSVRAELGHAGSGLDADLQLELFCELLRQVDPQGDNAALLRLVRQVCGRDTSEIETILSEFDASAASARNRRTEEMLKELSRSHAISGSAVVPNLDADQPFAENLQLLRDLHRRRLEDLIAKAGCR
jgi:hypothetical protein